MDVARIKRAFNGQQPHSTAQMPRPALNSLQQVLKILACLLVLKVTLCVMLGYRDYFPPDFDSDFLRGRQTYFYGAYQLAFYAHVISGPISLLVGLLLVSEWFRLRFPMTHRSLGKMQIITVLLLLSPSGLWMAYYAETGTVAALGFAVLAIVTGMCALLGWYAVVNRRFTEHRRWMLRCFLLLCSAVVLRLICGLLTVADIDAAWSYPLAAWVSWLGPLAAFELYQGLKRQSRWIIIGNKTHSQSSKTTSSLPAMEIIPRRTSADSPSLSS